VREGTMVDASALSAPVSTRNQGAVRDLEMKQTKKGSHWTRAK